MCHRLKGEEIVFEWFAFISSKDQLPLTLENLDQFEHEVSISVQHGYSKISRDALKKKKPYVSLLYLCTVFVLLSDTEQEEKA